VEYAYKRGGDRTFSETTEAVELSASAHGFVVQKSYDLGAALASKGFPIRPLMIFEIAPAEDLEDPVTLIMPCRINIYEENGRVVVAALRPSLFSAVFPEHELDEIAEEFERRVIDIVDGAVDGV